MSYFWYSDNAMVLFFRIFLIVCLEVGNMDLLFSGEHFDAAEMERKDNIITLHNIT